MSITAAALISTLTAQAVSATNRHTVAAPAAPARPSLADTATISEASQAALSAATAGTSPAQSDGTTSGLENVTGVSGTIYDFTNMTNSQAIAAAKTLDNDGKISAAAEMKIYMAASGWDHISVNPTTGASDPAAQATWVADHLSSTTPSNFENTFKGFINSDNYFHNTKEAALDTEVLQDMEKYSANASSASVTPAATGVIISTTA